jgi:hypothetical protein
LLLFIKQRQQPAALALLSALLFTGAVLATLERRADESRELRNLVGDEPLTLTGWLDGPPEFARDRVYLSLRVENVAGRVSLLAPIRDASTRNEFASLKLRYGSRISVTTTLDRAGNYRNPGVSSLAEFLDRNNYDATGIIKARLRSRVLTTRAGFCHSRGFTIGERDYNNRSTHASRRKLPAYSMLHYSVIATTFPQQSRNAFVKAAHFTYSSSADCTSASSAPWFSSW